MQPVERRLVVKAKEENGVDPCCRALEERYRVIAELTSDFTYELRLEPGGKASVTCLAGKVMPVLGCTVEELDALGGLEALLHPEDRALYVEHRAALRQGKPNQAEYRVRARSGELRWLRDRACPMQAEGKEGVAWVLGTVQDVTQQKEIPEALRLTQASVDHAADGILWIDDRARFIYANAAACRMLGETREALLEKRLYDVDAGVSAAQWPEYWEHLMSRGSETVEAEYRRREGQSLVVDVTTTYDEFNGQGFCFAFVRDASERKQYEAGLIRARREAEAMSRLKSAFLANMSHEIRTPLAAISGFASILNDEVSEQHRRFISFIERSGKRLLETLNSILNLSMLE
jgi:PAS domain S-box-containing protein